MAKAILKTAYNHVEGGQFESYKIGDDVSHLDAATVKALTDAGHIAKGKDEIEAAKAAAPSTGPETLPGEMSYKKVNH